MILLLIIIFYLMVLYFIAKKINKINKDEEGE